MSSDLLAFLLWYLIVTLAGLVALPLTFRFFRHLPDRGYAFARSLGLLVIGWVFWLLGSLGVFRNDAGSIVLAALLVGGVGVGWLKREGLNELRAWLVAQRATLIAVEVLFLAAFALMAWVRAYNPDIAGTEKPMELMFLNSVYRSPSLPPTDAWLSGHAISYYYFGYVMVASLARLANTAMPVAFNLGLALLFALTAVGSLGVMMNLIALTKEEVGRSKKEDSVHHLPASSFFLLPCFWPALLAPALVLVVGNFYGVARLAHDNGMWANTSVPAVYYDFGTQRDPTLPAQSLADYDPPPGVRAGMVNVWSWFDLKGANTSATPNPGTFVSDPGFWWWFSGARVVHDKNLLGQETEAIDEMPAFSFILGDLHPHVLALPFVILAIGLALEWLLWGASQSAPITNYQLLITTYFTRLLVSAILLGGLSFLNTWDFPIYWFLMTVGLVSGLGLAWGWDGVLKQWRMWGALALSIAILSVILYLPFYFTLQTQASGILPNLIYPTRFQQTVVMFGPVLVGVTILVVWLFRLGRAVWDRQMGLWAGGGLVLALVLAAAALTLGASLNPTLASAVDVVIAPLTRAEAMNLMWGRRLVDSLATLFPAAIIGVVVGLGVGLLRSPAGNAPPAESVTPESNERPWRRKRSIATPMSPEGLRSPALLMTLAMVLTGALLLLGPEYVYLRDYFGSRMNTLFKFYFQTWILWALASAFGLWYVTRFAGPVARAVMTGAMTLAMLAGLAYTVPGIYSKAGHFANPPTLDGLAYYRSQWATEWDVIDWFQQNVAGQVVVAEAVGGSYSEFGRVAMGTGLPTVLGWDFHERQWRGAYFDQVAGRQGDMQTLYQTRDWTIARDILDRYNIEYIVVSPIERNQYKPIALTKFDQNMRVVFQSDAALIYQRLESQAQ